MQHSTCAEETHRLLGIRDVLKQLQDTVIRNGVIKVTK